MGPAGPGTGDMLAMVYDPQGKAIDVYKYTDDAAAGRADLTLSNLSNKQKALRNIGGRPNRNLLDNWYSAGGGSQQGGGKFPINQRGFTSAGASNARTFDRWRTYFYSNGTVSLDPDGISISGTLDFGSPIESSRVPKIPGLVITISALNANGQLVTKTAPLLNNVTSQYVFEPLNWGGDGNLAYARNWNNSDRDLFYFNLLGYTGPKIVAAKLELGPIQTLAYQDEEGNWQLFETPDYGEELAKCQRHLLQLGSTGVSRVAVGYCTTASQIIVPIPIPTTMRINLPTVQYSALSDLTLYVNGTTIIIPTEVSVNFSSANTIDLIFTVSGATPGNAAILRILSNGFLRISAEL